MFEWKRIIICTIIILIIGSIIGYFVYKNNCENNNIDEYIPEEEISDSQARQTMLSLYFRDENGIVPEARFVDVKILAKNPYYEILKLLIEGPKNKSLKRTIPEQTKINKIEKDGDILIIDFSKEFIDKHEGGEKNEKITINSIVNTLTELTEINGIKIKIEGEESIGFSDGIVMFDEIFYGD